MRMSAVIHPRHPQIKFQRYTMIKSNFPLHQLSREFRALNGFLPTSPFWFLSYESSNHKGDGASIVVNFGNSPGSSHVSRHTKSIWRPSSPHQVSHSALRRETSGLSPTSHSIRRETSGLTRHHSQSEEREISGFAPNSHPSPRRGPWVSPREHIQPWGRSFRTKPFSDYHNTGLLWGFPLSLEPAQHQDIPRSERLSYFNVGGCEWQHISLHANFNNQAQ